VHELSIIVATKDRPNDLRTMLASVQRQTVKPAQIVIVDASAQPVEAVAREFGALNVAYRRHWPPSAAAQRNAGLAAVAAEATLVGFLDDDIVLEPDAVEEMLRFWNGATNRVGGAAFNWLNMEPRAMGRLKRSRFVDRLGLYSTQVGGVAASGWQTIVDPVAVTTRVRWLSSCAAVWRREVFARHQFDPYFDGYSYLEDLDFSYGVGTDHQLYVVAGADFRHYPAKGGRISNFHFGRVEVRNRLYFVRKHGLSVLRCYLGLGVRVGMSCISGLWQRGQWSRAVGNIVGWWTRSELRLDAGDGAGTR